VRAFAHATEDIDTVISAVRNILPPRIVDAVVFKKTNLSGHHGNPITLIETRIKDKDGTQEFFGNLSSGLGSSDKRVLCDEVEQHVERGNLYVRLDKQSACLGELKLSSTDPIHLRIHFKKHVSSEIIDICRQTGLLP
jgi:RNA binding exosome subunit